MIWRLDTWLAEGSIDCDNPKSSLLHSIRATRATSIFMLLFLLLRFLFSLTGEAIDKQTDCDSITVGLGVKLFQFLVLSDCFISSCVSYLSMLSPFLAKCFRPVEVCFLRVLCLFLVLKQSIQSFTLLSSDRREDARYSRQ